MAKKTTSRIKHIKWYRFLKDVLIVALSAYGGPNMHLALYNKRLVEEQGYLTSEELLELFSLCQMLPGPSSTQTLLSIAYKFGGPLLAFLTLLIWVLPAAIALIIISIFMSAFSESMLHALRYIQPIAIGFVLIAGVKMFKKAVKTKLDWTLAIFGFIVAALLRHFIGEYVKTPWIFPFVLLVGGVVSYYFTSRVARKSEPIKLNIPWRYLIAFGVIFIGAGAIGSISDNRLIILFENNYRFGSLVFGGGNVLIPMMYEQFVNFKDYLSSSEFLTGIGLVQAIPGPIFTIGSYTSSMAMQDYGTWQQILAGLTGTIAIFLPGTLLIFFVYPVWKQLKQHPVIVKALPGVIAASAGLVLAAAYLMFLPVGLNWVQEGSFYFTNLDQADPVNYLQLGIILVASVMLFKTKIASPWYIVAGILIGVII